MPAPLRHIDPNRASGVLRRAMAALSTTRIVRFLAVHVAWKLDPVLLRATRGRVSSTLLIPTTVLETRGAKSGVVRRNAVIYFHDSGRVTIVASRAGDVRHPAWFHNLVAHPDVNVGGTPMRATVVTEEAERDRLWPLADRVFPAFATYRRWAAEANRTIPIVQLEPEI